MNRRTFNKLASCAVAGALTANAAQTATSAEEVVLQDNELLVAFDAKSGALIRMERLSTHWPIQRRPELGVSFRLHAPLPHRRDNFVLGSKQRAVKVEKLSENRVGLQWGQLISEHGGTLPITVKATVTLENGALTFDSTLINDSPLVIETIDYPYLGDLNPPAPGEPMQTEHMWYGNLVQDEIHPHFVNEKGYWGVDFPTKTVESKQSLFCLMQSLEQGLYWDMHNPTAPYLLEYTFEQHPGVVDSINHEVPRPDAISAAEVHLEFRTCHFVFAQAHSTVKLVPVVMRSYSGDWHAGVDLYKQWRASWFQAPRLSQWVVDVHSWQQLQINAPEEDYTIPYRELAACADECSKNGVAAIQLVGWNRGGQDRGDPSQDTDPGLGTWQELHDAIAQIQARAVKIILFAKLNWADLTTAWYAKELYKYAATDPYGIPYQQGGYSYFTPTQLAGINNRRRAVMDFLCPAYRAIAVHEFQKVLDLGAAGWLFDEVCHHGPVDYSFSSSHGYSPPGYIYAGDIPMSKQLRAAADKVNPDFVFAGEGPQDWLMQYYPISYFRINAQSRPVCRYIDSQAPLMVAVTGFDDREMLNLILLNRYIISYEPYNFKGHLTDFPLTLAYGKKIDALRRKYKPWLWDAEFRDTQGAGVRANGSHRYSVFRTAAGKRAVVVINQESAKTIEAALDLPNAGNLLIATPEQPDAQLAPATLRIPARSAMVVMEQ
ncbi:MAG TPA: DUF6259 domain-containing protein [Bryobacteraceae bacterium]|nr:DUF6259 domain-containing protein [Bryobacteraceae bacterium]